MTIDALVNHEVKKIAKETSKVTTYGLTEQRQIYSLFVQQYLEKPVTTGLEPMAMTPTACTIKGIPVIDDF